MRADDQRLEPRRGTPACSEILLACASECCVSAAGRTATRWPSNTNAEPTRLHVAKESATTIDPRMQGSLLPQDIAKRMSNVTLADVRASAQLIVEAR